MSGYFEVKLEDIILSGKTHYPWGSEKYMVYINNQKLIRVNTFYREIAEGVYSCCEEYDRPLCNSIDELREMTMSAIEKQAYGSYMDGAR